MHVCVPYGALVAAGYDPPVAGLADLGVGFLEVEADAARRTPSLEPVQSVTHCLAQEAGARAYRAELYRYGARVAAIGGCSFDARATDGERGWLVDMVAAAEAVGAPMLRLAPSLHCPARFAEFIEGVLSAAPRSTVALAVEFGAASADTPRFYQDLLQRLDCRRVGLALDLGGLRGRAACDVVREFAPVTRHVQCSGDLDPAEIASLLGGSGYRGALSVGGVSPLDRPALRREVARLTEVLGEWAR